MHCGTSLDNHQQGWLYIMKEECCTLRHCHLFISCGNYFHPWEIKETGCLSAHLDEYVFEGENFSSIDKSVNVLSKQAEL